MARCGMAVLVVLLVAGAAHGWDKPWFCHEQDCPIFKVVRNVTENVQIREYQPSYWFGAEFQGADNDAYDRYVQEGFQVNFKYISGTNAKSEKIDMTAPVAVKIVPGQGPNCNTTFNVWFMTPYVHQPPHTLPAPTDPSIKMVTLPAVKVAVLSHGGYSNKWTDVAPHFQELAAALTKEKISFDPEPLFTADYDPPFRVIGRHNEVWFLLK